MSVYKLRGLVMDETRYAVMINGKEVKLTIKEYKILQYLLQNTGMSCSFAEIYESIWQMKAVDVDNILAVHVRHIREKIEEDPRNPQFIKSVWGEGYRID